MITKLGGTNPRNGWLKEGHVVNRTWQTHRRFIQSVQTRLQSCRLFSN